MPSLSIISANVDSPEWVKLLVKSIRKFTTDMEHEIIIVDNNSMSQNLSWLKEQGDIKLVLLDKNYGHGEAIDLGTGHARHEFICALDVDAHVQREGWANDLIDLYNESKKIKFIGCKGPEHKPLKPPLFFYEKSFIVDNALSFKHIPGISSDTAQKLYHDIVNLGFSVERISPGCKIYKCYGDEFYVDEKPTFYHHWYGTRFCENRPERKKEELDGYRIEDYLANKAKLFEEPLVKEILRVK